MMSEAAPEQLRTTRPALDVLDKDQDRLLYEGDTRRTPEIQPLSRGFDSYWMLLSWYQAATVRTLGHVERVIAPKHIMPGRGITDHVILPFEREESAFVRRRLVEELDDACDMAYRQFRERANERVEGEETKRTYNDIDPEKEKSPLMRPAFNRLDSGQAAVLISLWEGFDDREAVGRWVRSLGPVSNGEKPRKLLTRIISSPPLLEALTDTESRNAQLTRYRFAAGVVMPSFLAAARTLNGGERAEGETRSHGAFKS